MTNTAVQKGLASKYVVKAKPGQDEARPSLVQKWLASRYVVKAKPGKDEVRPSLSKVVQKWLASRYMVKAKPSKVYRNGWPADTWSRPSLARTK